MTGSGIATAAGFWLLAVVAVASGIAVFRVTSMARATYALALSFVAVGAALLLVHLDYLGLVTVLMMVMEMAVMAVYMIMFMGMNPALMAMDMTHGTAARRGAVVLAAGTFAVLAAGALLVPWPSRRQVPADQVRDAVHALGASIMGPKMLVMLAVSAVLFATVVAALSIAHPRGRYDRFGDDLGRRTADDPLPGGVGR